MMMGMTVEMKYQSSELLASNERTEEQFPPVLRAQTCADMSKNKATCGGHVFCRSKFLVTSGMRCCREKGGYENEHARKNHECYKKVA